MSDPHGVESTHWGQYPYLNALILCFTIVASYFAYEYLVPPPNVARPAAKSTQSKYKLKQLGLSLHNYHDVHKMFPPGGIYRDEQSYHGWAFSILPYIDQAPLFNSIDYHVPWTSKVNKEAYTTRVRAFQNPRIGETSVVNGYPVNHYAGSSHLFHRNGGTRIKEITDGTANTILAGEISDGFMPWGAPMNVRDPSLGLKSSPQHFGVFKSGTIFLFADASVKRVSDEIDADLLRRLATPSGGETIDSF